MVCLRGASCSTIKKTTFALLIKKQLISSFLLCVFSIVFAHSVIPHHHHDEIAIAHHDNQNNNDHDKLDNNFLGQLFSHLQHDSGSSIIYEASSSSSQCLKINPSKDVILFTWLVIKQLYKPPPLTRKAHSAFIFLPSGYSDYNFFRGPPMA